MRVHELAKEYKISAKDALARLAELGIEAKTIMSVLDEAEAVKFRESLRRAPIKPQAARPAPAPKPAKPAIRKPIMVPLRTKPAPPPLPQRQETPTPAPPQAAEPAPPEPARQVSVPPLVRQESGKAAAEPSVQTPPKRSKAAAQPAAETGVEVKDNVIKFKGHLIVRDLAHALGVRPNTLIAELMRMNVLASINQVLDLATARKIAEQHGYTLEHERRGAEHPPVPRKPSDEPGEEDKPEDLVPRPPVVTFMGHVDHGKTSLLDRIRKTSVAKEEHGGITQHIGAYTVEVSGRKITFLDTPGHEAFTAMRARGANLTDIVVLVVAADDGVMPQTKEAIQHAKAANVTIMVAINKTDLPNANPLRVMQQLQAEGLTPEEWGGNTICVPVSAASGAGIDHLLEMILLQADVLDLRANPNRRASGFVIEAALAQGSGPTATLLVKRGTLKIGDAVVCGPHYGRVRALISDRGVKVKSASPGIAVKCLGLSGVPDAGAEFKVCVNDKAARELAEQARLTLGPSQTAPQKKMTVEDLLAKISEQEQTTLNVILKADTQGSIEAITKALGEIKSDKVSLNIILKGAGNVTSNDVMLASASKAIIVGFHVSKEPGVEAQAKHEGVPIQLYQIIYELVDGVRDAMAGLLTPVVREKIMGRAVVKQTFPIGKKSKVAGCMVTSGVVRARYRVRVKRKNETLFEGSILSLKRFQDQVAEVRQDQECGIRLDKFDDFVENDVLEFYELEESKPTL